MDGGLTCARCLSSTAVTTAALPLNFERTMELGTLDRTMPSREHIARHTCGQAAAAGVSLSSFSVHTWSRRCGNNRRVAATSSTHLCRCDGLGLLQRGHRGSKQCQRRHFHALRLYDLRHGLQNRLQLQGLRLH